MDIIEGLDAWFVDRLKGLHYRPETVAYVTSVLKTLARPSIDDDFSDRSIVLSYYDARKSGDFAKFQRIGDWVLWTGAIVPESIARDREIIESIGRLSYYTCYRIMRSSWPVYEELADQLPAISAATRVRLI